MGDSREILEEAVLSLARRLGEFRCSGIYRSAPLYVTDQPPFLNAVAGGIWYGTAESLLDLLQSLEASFGRDRSVGRRYGPRRLDLDLLLFGAHSITSQRLTVPHPRMHERRFVLEPLVELAPELRDPLHGTIYRRRLHELSNQMLGRIYDCPCENGGRVPAGAGRGCV
jgi:2-amino-4-hydroxy-6-hydroxymethyldihydropteridine diphosphokinase